MNTQRPADKNESLAELRARIMAAERAVIERDERIRRHAEFLTERIRSRIGAATGVSVGVGTVALLAARLAFRRRRKPAVASPKTLAIFAIWPWVARFAPLLAPMLPLSLTSRLPPAVVAVLATLGVPLAVGQRPTKKPPVEASVTTAREVDLERYMGRWYEIARFPMRQESACASHVAAHYSLRPDGTIGVVNSCLKRDGSEAIAQGVARVVEESNGSKLKVSFAPKWLRKLPFFWADYWILHVDPDYGMAVVGTPDRKHLWVLARIPRISEADFERVVDRARAQGYDTARLQITLQ